MIVQSVPAEVAGRHCEIYVLHCRMMRKCLRGNRQQEFITMFHASSTQKLLNNVTKIGPSLPKGEAFNELWTTDGPLQSLHVCYDLLQSFLTLEATLQCTFCAFPLLLHTKPRK